MQDGGFREQSDEHDESRLHVDVVLQSPQTGEEERASQSEGHAENDGERDEQTLVEGAENQIDKDDADDEYQCGGVLRRCFLACHASELIAVALGQHLGSRLADGVDSLSATVAFGGGASDHDAREEVEARESLGAVDARQCQVLSDG